MLEEFSELLSFLCIGPSFALIVSLACKLIVVSNVFSECQFPPSEGVCVVHF